MATSVIRLLTEGFGTARDEALATGDAMETMGRDTERGALRSRGALASLSTGFKGIGAAIGITTLAFGLKDLTESGMKLQAQQTQLQSALRATGNTGADAYNKMNQAAVFSSEHGGFSRDQELQSITQFVANTKSSTLALRANADAVSLARRFTLPYISAQRYIGQALVGNVKRLQQFVGVIEPVKSAEFALAQSHHLNIDALDQESKAMGKAGPQWLKLQELSAGITPQMAAQAQQTDKLATAQEVLARVQSRTNGATAAFNNSTQGKLSNLKNTLGEVTGAIGEALLPEVNALATAGMWLAQMMDKNKTLTLALAGAVTFLAGAAAIRALAKGVSGLIGDMWTLGKRMVFGAATSDTLAGSVEGAGAASDVAAGQMALFGAAEDGATVATGGLAGALTLMDSIPIVAAIALISIAVFELATHFKQVSQVAVDAFNWIETAVTNVWSWIKGHFALIATIIAGPIGLAAVEIIEHFRQIKKFIEGVFGWIGTAAKNTGHVLGNALGTNAWSLSEVQHRANPVQLAAINKQLIQIGASPVKHLYSGGVANGTDVIPSMLSAGEFVLNRATVQQVGVSNLDALNNGFGLSNFSGGGAGGQPNFTITPGTTVVKLDSRVLAEAVTRYVLKRAARGPSSMSGGPMTTGYSGGRAIETV